MANGPGGVDRRRATDLDPHPDRVKRIRQWHIERASSDTRPVALVAVHITEHGHINTDSIAVEPEHASIIACELQDLAKQLRAMASAIHPHLIRVK